MATITYTDLDLKFIAHPVSKDLVRKIDSEAVKGAVRNLLLTMHYERPFDSGIGSSLKAMLFEPITPVIYGIIKKDVSTLIETYEPRVTVSDVVVKYLDEQNTINIQVIFTINGTSQLLATDLTLQRTR